LFDTTLLLLFQKVNVSKKELLESCRVHMRDLLQLGLDVPFRLRHVNRLPPQLLQRGDSILALVGPFKVINRKTIVAILEEGVAPIVAQAVPALLTDPCLFTSC
jgi:hypothetical protein